MKDIKLFLFLFFVSISPSYGQGEAALPFLLLPTSPKLTGSGAAGTATLLDDPYKFFFNPAHLGFSAHTENLSSGFYPQKIDWLGWNFPLSSYVFNAGYNLENKFPSIPLSIGIGYSKSQLSYGKFYSNRTGQIFESKDSYSSYSLGIGYQSIINLSAGFTVKNIISVLSDQPTEKDSKDASLEATAMDYGILVNVPLNNFLSGPLNFDIFGSQIYPDINYTIGYAIQNIGDEVYYIDPSQSDLLPRTARLAHNIDIAINLKSEELDLRLLNLSYSIDADDILAETTWDTITFKRSMGYQGIFGDIDVIDNLFLGKWNGDVAIHKGLAVEFFDMVYLSTGSLRGRGWQNLQTEGFGFRAKGLLTLLNIPIQSPTLSYIIEHFDVQYSSSEYVPVGSPFKSNYSGIFITVKGF